MLTRVFLLLVAFVAIAVQAAPTNHFISPEQAKAIESNDLKTYLQATGSGGSAADIGVSTFTVTPLDATHVQIDFVAAGLTNYYFMAAEQGSTVPSASDTMNFIAQNKVGTHVETSQEADYDASFVMEVDGSDSIDIYASSYYDSTLYPSDGETSQDAQLVSASIVLPPNVDITSAVAQLDEDGSFEITFTTNAAGSYQVFAYQCCDLVYRGAPKCEIFPTVCSDGSKIAELPVMTDPVNVTAGEYTVSGVADSSLFLTPYGEFTALHLVFTADVDGAVSYFVTQATLADSIAPIWEVTPVVDVVDGESITFTGSVDDPATFYYVAVATGATPAPTADEIIAAGNTGMTVTGLTDETTYDVYVVAVSDMSGNSEVVSFTATTDDITPPTVETIAAGAVTRETATVTVSCDEACTMYGVLTTDAAATYNDIVFGGNAVDLVDTDATDASVLTFDFDTLEPDTTYFLSAITFDAVENTDGVVSTVEFTTEPLYVFNTEVYNINNDVAVIDASNYNNEVTLDVTPTSGVLVQTPIPVDTSGVGPEQATISFYGGVEGDVYTLSLMTTAWTAAGATSECAASLAGKCVNADWAILADDGSVAAGGVTATVTDGKLVFDVTADVAAFIAGDENFGWFLSGPTGSFDSSEGVNGPELTLTFQEDVSAGQNAFGPVCEHDDLSLTCATGVININQASYGRHNNFQCPYSGGAWAMTNTQCHGANSLSVVSEACNGQTSCSVSATNAVFSDPCRGTYKYLEGSYACVVNTGDFCSGFVASDAQVSCVSSASGPVYTCGDGFSGDACDVDQKAACAPLVAHLSFDDESSIDVSCNENHGEDVNSPVYINGVTGRAASYEEGQYAHVADDASLQLSSEFSACLWVNADMEDGVKNGHTSMLLSQGVMGGAGSAGRQGFGIYLNADNKYGTGARAAVRFERERGRQTLEQAFTIDGNWHFICAVFSAEKQSFYVDAAVVTEDRFAGHGGVVPSTQGIYVGTDFEVSKYQANGAIDEVKIYNVALSQDEVSEIFSADGGLGATTGFFEAADTTSNEDDMDHVVLNAGASGCTDGSREGFHAQDGIAACAGTWTIPGVATAESFDRACDGTSGDGCSVADICAVGWHVCYDAAEVLAKSDGLGCNGVSDFADGFFVSRQSGNGNINMVAEGTNDVFGCGDGASIGSANEARGLNAFTHNKCSRVSGFSCEGNGQGLDEALTITHSGSEGGAMCCRDDRQINSGQQKSGAKQVEVKVKKDTGKSHTDDEDCKAYAYAIEKEVNKKTGKSCKVKAVRKRSGSSNDSNNSKQSKGGKRRLLQTTNEPQYTYIVYEVIPGASADGTELATVNSVVIDPDSELNTEFTGIEGFNELHSCEDGTMQASCDGSNTIRETTALPAGSVGDGYGETETATLGNSSDIVNAVIVTASVFVLLIVSGFAYRAHTAKSVDQEFDARIMNSSQQASDVEMAAKGGEQDTYWVFNKQTEGQNVRVVV